MIYFRTNKSCWSIKEDYLKVTIWDEISRNIISWIFWIFISICNLAWSNGRPPRPARSLPPASSRVRPAGAASPSSSGSTQAAGTRPAAKNARSLGKCIFFHNEKCTFAANCLPNVVIFGRLVLRCVEADFATKLLFCSSTRFVLFCTAPNSKISRHSVKK